MLKQVWILVFWALGIFAHAETIESSSPQPLPQKKLAFDGITMTYGSTTPGLNLQAKLPDSNVKTLDYNPATLGKTFFGVDYNGYGASISTANPRGTQFRQKYGNGLSEDYQLRALWRGLYFEGFYQKYRGYYLNNASSVMSNPYGPNNELPQFHNLRVESYGIQLIHYHNLEKFNPKRAFDLTEKLTESGGTWFFSYSINSYRVSSPTSIVPATAFDNYGQLNSLRIANSLTGALGAGLAYSYILAEHFVFSGQFGLAAGVQSINAKYTNKREKTEMGTTRVLARIGTGFSGDQFFVGLQAISNITAINNNSTHLDLNTTQAQVAAGWRF